MKKEVDYAFVSGAFVEVEAPATRKRTSRGRTALYRHFAESGELLYVGISLNVAYRTHQHHTSPWWDHVTRIEIERFDSREDAIAAERKAVETEKPAHNQRLLRKSIEA